MTTPEVNIWLPAAAALAGGLIASIAPVFTGILNARAEARRERLRLAVQLALEDHKHLMDDARRKTAAHHVTVGVPPISAIFSYHAEVLTMYQKKGALEPGDFVAIRQRNAAVFEALRSMEERQS